MAAVAALGGDRLNITGRDCAIDEGASAWVDITWEGKTISLHLLPYQIDVYDPSDASEDPITSFVLPLG